MDQAEQAARAGADSLDTGRLRDGAVAVDPNAAVTAAQRYLHQVGAHGTVAVGPRGTVTVTVTTEQQTAVLSAVGIASLSVQATATAVSIDQDDG